MTIPFWVRCLIHGRLRRHSHCWDCERPVFGAFRCDDCRDGVAVVIAP